MIKINEYITNGDVYEIFLTSNSLSKADELGIHTGIFKGAVTRLVNRNLKKYSTYFFAEQNILFFIEFESPNKFIFLDIKRINIIGNRYVSKLDDSVDGVKTPVFFKSYEDGRKVYLNQNLPLKMKKNNIPPHYISLREIIVPEGQHTLYENGLIIDFEFTNDGKYYITDIIKPDLLNFGLAVVKN